MKVRDFSGFRTHDRGAVAATYALSLFALVAVAGVAFDYARLAGMDSELQNGADQAALAGATQLNKEDGACARATNAAIALLNNETLLANDIGERSVQINGGTTITVADDVCSSTTGIAFYSDKAKTPATGDDDAAFIEVTVDQRIAEYAFTPIVGALNSGRIDASAMAGLGSSICKVPPLMICSPTPSVVFDAANKKGWGVMATGHGSVSTWAAGAFGFLEVGQGQTEDLAIAIAFGGANLDCAPIEGTSPEPGNAQVLYDAINTRFDVYNFPSAGNVLGNCHNGLCPPSPNSTKDLVNTNTDFTGQNACKLHNNGWKLPTNRFFPQHHQSQAQSATTVHDANGVDAMGYTRDLCHYNSYIDPDINDNSVAPTMNCRNTTGLSATQDPDARFGNGHWARADYFNHHHGGFPSAAAQSWTRYETYLWEQGKFGSGGTLPNVINGQRSAPVCQPASTAALDRRILTVAVVTNCSAIRGGSREVDVDEWVDMFLVEPIVDDNDERDNGRVQDGVYMEVIGPATVGQGGGLGAQTIRRDVPYLVE